jgi:phenylpyruvate tautomerase PptA (4-oxalocrotonate tautomerase family)
MPTYTLTVPAGHFDVDRKAAAAGAITSTHNAVTGAATFFAQVIIHEMPDGHYFVGGKPLVGRQVFLNGQIRAGRSAIDRKRLLIGLRDAIASGLGVPTGDVWVYLTDLPAGDMIEYGHILPEPGDEASWMAGLPASDRERMEKTGR